MSTAVLDMTATLVRREQSLGATKPQAIARVARRARVSPGQIEGVLRARVKGIKLAFAARIHAAFVAETLREIERLTHDLQAAREAGLGADESTVIAAHAAMARLKMSLAEAAQ